MLRHTTASWEVFKSLGGCFSDDYDARIIFLILGFLHLLPKFPVEVIDCSFIVGIAVLPCFL